MECPIVFKMIVLGQQGVGKSAMLIRYMKGVFMQHYHVTVGVQFATKSVVVDGNQQINLQIWDTSGQQTFRSLVRTFYNGISGVFLAYAIDKEDSLKALEMWHKEAKQNGHEQVMFFMVGTRSDLEERRKVTPQKAEQLMRSLGALFNIETSAKNNENISCLFEKAAEIMYKKYIASTNFRRLNNCNMIRGRQTSFILDNHNNGSQRYDDIKEKNTRRCCG